MAKHLDQSVFKGQPQKAVVACVDYDGRLKFGDSTNIRFTWASEVWRGANWLACIDNSGFKPLTMILRDAEN